MKLTLSLVVITLAVGCWARKSRTGAANTNANDAARPEVVCASQRKTCQNFDSDSVKQLNLQINEELKASYVYQSMSFYFGRDDIALRGFSKFFHEASGEEREHAHKLMDYLSKRGGTLILNDITKPTQEEWGSGLDALKMALRLEHHVNDKLLDLHWLAQQKNDPHLQDYLEGEFLTEQVDSIKQFSDFVSVLGKMEITPLGEFLFDQELYDGKR